MTDPDYLDPELTYSLTPSRAAFTINEDPTDPWSEFYDPQLASWKEGA